MGFCSGAEQTRGPGYQPEADLGTSVRDFSNQQTWGQGRHPGLLGGCRKGVRDSAHHWPPQGGRGHVPGNAENRCPQLGSPS